MALKGIRVLEMAGLAPAPFCGMVLRDFGASVIRIDRPTPQLDPDRLCRGKRSVMIDLKKNRGVDLVRKMANASDVLIEGYRPGVMERIGLGPDVLLQSNPRLVYARLTGFGQTGPASLMAGHDINFIALSGQPLVPCLLPVATVKEGHGWPQKPYTYRHSMVACLEN